jgi:hypothetical protein
MKREKQRYAGASASGRNTLKHVFPGFEVT